LSAGPSSKFGSNKGRNIITVLLITIVGLGAGMVTANFFFHQNSRGSPEPFLGVLDAKQLNCSLSNGTCSMLIVNNSTASISLDFCNINVFTSSLNGSARTSAFPNGTLTGQAAIDGVPAKSAVAVNCTIPTTSLSYESNGSVVAGTIWGTSNAQWYSDPAGSKVGINFEGTWS
jgi:hypothetical protein